MAPPPSAAVVEITVPPLADKQDDTHPTYKLTQVSYVHFLDNPPSPKPTRGQILEAKTRKEILSVFAKYGSKDGTNSYPSVETIMFCVDCSERTVQRHKIFLQSAGYLTLTPREGRSDICSVCIPAHVWVVVQAGLDEIREKQRRRARQRWGDIDTQEPPSHLHRHTPVTIVRQPPSHTCQEPPSQYVNNPRHTVTPDLLSISSNTSSYISEGQKEKQSSKDDGPKQVHGQRKPLDDFKLRVAKLTSNKILFTTGQTWTLKKVLSDFTSDELFMGFSLAWDEISDDQIKYMAPKFVANAHVQAQQGRYSLLKKAAEHKAVSRKVNELQAEAEQNRVERAKARKRELELVEEELPD